MRKILYFIFLLICCACEHKTYVNDLVYEVGNKGEIHAYKGGANYTGVVWYNDHHFCNLNIKKGIVRDFSFFHDNRKKAMSGKFKKGRIEMTFYNEAGDKISQKNFETQYPELFLNVKNTTAEIDQIFRK